MPAKSGLDGSVDLCTVANPRDRLTTLEQMLLSVNRSIESGSDLAPEMEHNQPTAIATPSMDFSDFKVLRFDSVSDPSLA